MNPLWPALIIAWIGMAVQFWFARDANKCATEALVGWKETIKTGEKLLKIIEEQDRLIREADRLLKRPPSRQREQGSGPAKWS